MLFDLETECLVYRRDEAVEAVESRRRRSVMDTARSDT
jgi:hypothetical protein